MFNRDNMVKDNQEKMAQGHFSSVYLNSAVPFLYFTFLFSAFPPVLFHPVKTNFYHVISSKERGLLYYLVKMRDSVTSLEVVFQHVSKNKVISNLQI